MTALRTDDVRALVRAGGMLLVAGIAARALDWIFSSRPILAVVIGAFFLDLWAQRIGARWMPGNPEASTARRLFAGMGTGLALGLFVVLLAAMLGAAHLSLTRASAASVGIGVLRTAAYAFRDELLFRGVPLALTRGHVPHAWSIAFSVALSVAPLVLSAGGVAPLALTASSAFLFATIWLRGAGGFAAWVIHVGWRIAVEVVAGGSGLEVTYLKGALPSTEGAEGLPAYLGTAAFALAAFVLYRRTK